jgi:spore coat polysaccharide biosynthesis protein SpsF
MRQLLYRVDGGATLGLGHVTRAFAIAEAARRHGWQVTWASTGGPEVISAAREAGAALVEPGSGEAEATFLSRVGKETDAIVIDRKLPYGGDVIRRLRGERPVVLLDVPCDGMFEATATIFPTAHLDSAIANDTRWQSGRGRLVHGAPWVVIHPRVLATPKARQPARPARVAVTTGGSDPENVASQALDWLDLVEGDFKVDLMVGVANRQREPLKARATSSRHETRVLERPNDFAAELAGATVAVATFGITAYELAYLGVPAVLVSHGDENVPASARFETWGTAVDLGLAKSVEPARAAGQITQLLGDAGRRKQMRDAGRKLVDGKGADRIVELLQSILGDGKR